MCRYRSEFFGLTHMDRDFVAEKVIDGIVNENENIFVPEFLKFVGFILGYVHICKCYEICAASSFNYQNASIFNDFFNDMRA